MNRRRALLFSICFLVLPCAVTAQCTKGTVAVLTSQYDNLRDSVNANETCLTPVEGTFYGSNNKPVFVEKAAFPTIVSGGKQSPIYAQPLYAPGVSIGGGKHNVVYVATLGDVVYAYDADNYGSGAPGAGVLYWSDSLVGNCTETVDGVTYPGKLATPAQLPGVYFTYFGIISTPVIDPASGILYAVNACVVTGPTNPGLQWYLNALHLGTGANAAPPVAIAGGVTNAYGSTAFTPNWQLQRSGLLLTTDAAGNHLVYLAFGAGVVEGDPEPPYHGWVFAYTLSGGALVQQSIFDATPPASVYSSMCNSVLPPGYPLPPNWCGQGGGIWMSGRGPAEMSINGTNSIFVAVSDGGFQTMQPVNFGESILRFNAGEASVPADFFTPSDWYVDENENDEDMGTSGIVLFNGQVNGATRPFAAVLDKAGNLFLMHAGALGGFNTPDKIVQEFLATSSTVCPQLNVSLVACNEPHSLVFWNDRLYVWALNSKLRVFQFSNGTFLLPDMEGAWQPGYPGGILALSSNGTANGILWALSSTSTRDQREPGTLTAFDATSLTPLWSSTDAMELSAFAEPTVMNGRVYVPTYDHGLLVYSNH